MKFMQAQLDLAERECVTVKFVLLAVDPPSVLITIFPVTAPLGTLAVTWLLELTTTVVAATPPNVTLVVCVSPAGRLERPYDYGNREGIKDTEPQHQRSDRISHQCRQGGCQDWCLWMAILPLLTCWRDRTGRV